FPAGRTHGAPPVSGGVQQPLLPETHGSVRFYTEAGTPPSNGCALGASGDAFCWGNGGRGRLEHGFFHNVFSPVAVVGGHKFATLVSGHGRTVCGITMSGEGDCWGDNSQEQLGADLPTGLGLDSRSNVPVRILFEWR